MEIIVIDNRSFKQKVRDGMHTVGEKAKKVLQVAMDNPEITISVGLTVVCAVSTLVSKVNKAHEIHENELRRTSSFYDRSLNCYWQTKRPLTADEMLEVEARKAAGESIGHILKSMGLLKKVR